MSSRQRIGVADALERTVNTDCLLGCLLRQNPRISSAQGIQTAERNAVTPSSD